MEKTNDGKKGGWLVGKRHYDKSGKPIGGIPAVVGDSKRPVELEGGEVIINREASKKYWRELSKINQSAGNGVPIKPQDVGADEDPEEYKEGGKVIEFNPNHIPNKRIYNYAKSIKEDYPKVWGLGGNIFGNEAFKNLERVINRGYWTDNEEWMYIKWRSYVARHKQDFRIAGVIAMLKWVDVVDRGWDYMKDLIEKEIDKRYPKKGFKAKMTNGGRVDNEIVFVLNQYETRKFMKNEPVWFEHSDGSGTEALLLEKTKSGKAKIKILLDYKPYSRLVESNVYVSKKSFSKYGEKDAVKEGTIKIVSPYKVGNIKDYMPYNHKPISKEFINYLSGQKGIDKKGKGGGVDDKLAFIRKNENGNFWLYEINEKGNDYQEVDGSKRLYVVKDMAKRWGYKLVSEKEFKNNYKLFKGGAVTYKQKYNKKYGYDTNETHDLSEVAKDTGVSKKGLQQIYNKGIGAYKTNPESVRPNVKSKEQWAMGRVYSAVMGGKAARVDAKELKMETGGNLYHLGGDMSKHLAPNGKPSNLTHEQWHLVRTPEFKAWFGDWENSPKTASKVVDENGEPLVVYHGSRSEVKFAFSEFNVPQEGVYFSSDYKTATWFSDGFDYKLQFEEIELPSNINENSTLKDLEKYYKENIDTTAYVSLYNFDDGSVMYRLEAYNETSSTPLGKNLQDAQKRLYKEINYRLDDINNGMKRPFYRVFLNIRSPYKIDAKGKSFYETPFEDGNYSAVSVTSTIKSRGKNDGVIIENTIETTEINRKSNSYIVFNPTQIKLADGTNTTFDGNNPDIRFMAGGNVEDLISEGIVDLKMYDTTNEHSKLYGFDAKNPLYIQSIIVAKEHRNKGIGSKVMKYINDYAKKNEHDLIFGNITKKAEPNIDVIKSMMVKSGFNTCEGNNDFYKQIYADGGLIALNGNGELAKGIKTEQEHKDTLEKIASGEITVNQAIKMTAKDHLKENPKYYTELAKIEKHDVGGALSSYALKTPNGEKSRLTYLQQILVRTEKFKEFFGDWETAAKNYLLDNKENYKVHFKNVSKVMDMSTLEPRVVYHGTRSDAEFFTFDVSMEKGQGRPYAYFAHNREYSENFTEFSQRGHTNSSGYLYECFLNVRNPFMAMGHEYEFKLKDYEGWINAITGTIALDKYQTIEKNETTKKLEKAIRAQVEDYMSSLNNEKNQFWKYMAADTKSVFKFFLISYGYDGIFYGEEIANNYDAENPKEYTNAVTIFSAKDIKLADGRNLNFNPMETDIRYEDGGSVEKPQKTMSKKDRLGSILFGEKYANGGFIEDTIGYKSVEKPMDDARTFVEQLNKKMKE